MSIDAHDSELGHREMAVLNTQISGANHAEKWRTFKTMAQRWRLAYQSVTVYQDGPDLANQGTIVVSQPPVAPVETTVCDPDQVYNLITVVPRVNAYTAEDLPDFSTSQSMPNAYFNRSRDGAYVPLKLTETCQDWCSEKDAVMMATLPAQNPYGGFWNVTDNTNVCFPHYDLMPLRYDRTPPVGLPRLYGEATAPMMSGGWAHICAKNLSPQTSYSFFFRMGLEMQVSPTSTLSPQLKLSPPYDRLALDAYFSVARELKDAYPADYNDLGEMWDVISKGAKAALPIIMGFGGPYAKAAGIAIKGITGVGDVIRVERQKKKIRKQERARGIPNAPAARVTSRNIPAFRGETLSAAQIERARAGLAMRRYQNDLKAAKRDGSLRPQILRLTAPAVGLGQLPK